MKLQAILTSTVLTTLAASAFSMDVPNSTDSSDTTPRLSFTQSSEYSVDALLASLAQFFPPKKRPRSEDNADVQPQPATPAVVEPNSNTLSVIEAQNTRTLGVKLRSLEDARAFVKAGDDEVVKAYDDKLTGPKATNRDHESRVAILRNAIKSYELALLRFNDVIEYYRNQERDLAGLLPGAIETYRKLASAHSVKTITVVNSKTGGLTKSNKFSQLYPLTKKAMHLCSALELCLEAGEGISLDVMEVVSLDLREAFDEAKYDKPGLTEDQKGRIKGVIGVSAATKKRRSGGDE